MPNMAPPSSAKNPSDKRDQLEIAKRVPPDGLEHLHLRRWLLQLDEHAVRRRRMDEGDHARLRRPGARLLVDQANAAALQMRERGLDVVHAQRHVMHAGPRLLQVFRNRRIGRGGLEQLQRRLRRPPESGRGRSATRISSLASTCSPSTSLKNASEACRSLTAIPT